MIEEVRKDIFRIPVDLPNSPLKILNSYVIKGGDRNILIDTGFRRTSCINIMREAIKELELDMNKTDILLTHLHSDHSGLAPTLARPGTRVYISRKEIPWLLAETRDLLWNENNLGFVRAGFSPELVYDEDNYNKSSRMSPALSFKDYLPIDDGDEFVCGDYTLKAIATPGHTPEHMCFWIEEQKIMFTGDHVLFDITPNITRWAGVEDSLGDYLASLRAIDKYDVELALPSHRATGDFHGRIAHLLSHHEGRLEECFRVVQANPGLSIYDIAGKMTWKIRCNSWEDFPLNQKWFAVGECQSHLDLLEKQGRVIPDKSCEIIKYSAV